MFIDLKGRIFAILPFSLSSDSFFPKIKYRFLLGFEISEN
jgi:hypothetical protein